MSTSLIIEGRADKTLRGNSGRSDMWERARLAECLEDCLEELGLAAGGGREAESDGRMSSSARELQSSLEGCRSDGLRLLRE